MHIIVIGGGIQGLCTAEYLSGMTGIQCTLIEQFSRFHKRGSSHGLSRITRSAYSNRLYVELMQQCHQEIWPSLEDRLGVKIIHPVKGCFMGPKDGLFQSYSQAVKTGGAAVEELDHRKAQIHFPQFKINPEDGVLLDHTAGIIHAETLVEKLWQRLESKGVYILENTRVNGIDLKTSTVHTTTGAITGDKLILCAGPWVGTLFPQLVTPKIKVVRQAVTYWQLKDPALGRAPEFPVWVEMGKDNTELWYGLPAIKSEGIKVARHNLVGDDDPDLDINGCSEPQIEQIRGWIQKRMSIEIAQLLSHETCLYSVTETEDFILDHHPSSSNLLIGAGFSGHGFKFAPMVGQILAERAVGGCSSISKIEENADRFHF